MRRADIEVPNLAVDVTLCNSLQRRLYLYLFRDSGVSWKSLIRRKRLDFHPSLMREVVTGEACKACLVSGADALDSRAAQHSLRRFGGDSDPYLC